MTFEEDLQDLIRCYEESPHPSYKVTSYFSAYTELFRHLRNTKCSFIETGVLNGGSLFMWRAWLGPDARIIGCDLNPDAVKWRSEGFDIFVGDQGDRQFWREVYKEIGEFDVLLDDGGHFAFQQIVTLTEAIRAAKAGSRVVIEDTCTSMMSGFRVQDDRTFLNYAKTSTDVLTARMAHMYPLQFPPTRNDVIIEEMKAVTSIQFFPGIVAYRIDPALAFRPELVWNRKPVNGAEDYRLRSSFLSAEVEWPDPFMRESVIVKSGSK